jgi:hypothetical protein
MTNEDETKLKEILGKNAITEKYPELGCSDGYCIIRGKAKGMHTNGGCKCHKEERAIRIAMVCLNEQLKQAREILFGKGDL